MEREPAITIHPLGPTPGIKPVQPSKIPDSSQCETTLSIGLFFDGTGNNKDWDDSDACHVGHGTQTERRRESNVARLFFAYPDDPRKGYYRHYISGVGTPFEPIGEIEPARTGMAFGGGGDGRINYGLLQVVNSIHRAVTRDDSAYSEAAVLALCRNGHRNEYRMRDGTVVRDTLAGAGDEAALRTVGMAGEGGLLMDTLGGSRRHASAFYRREVARLAEVIGQARKPKLAEVFIDVFGFSRGAAEARTFCNWLDEWFDGDTLAGVPTTVRFLGIFDTVASVGVPNAPSETYGLTNGHMAWGAEKYLRIPDRVKNCVHFVAMHENRASFPLDRVCMHDVLPANCREYAFPGMHSDVGGGYGLNEQGRGRLPTTASHNDLNSEKLSQIPLGAMLAAAQTAKVPLDTDLVVQTTGITGYDPFKIDGALHTAYEAFHAACSPAARQPGDWLMSYLAWRYQVRDRYADEPWFERADAVDRDDLVGANAVLCKDVEALEKNWLQMLGSDVYDAFKNSNVVSSLALPESSREIRRKLAPEAPNILERMRGHAHVSSAEALLFSTYVHDSVAGFRPFDHPFDVPFAGCVDLMPGSWEPEGYLRYRRFYTGINMARTYTVEVPAWQREAQQAQQTANIRGLTVDAAFNAMRGF